MVSSKKLTEQQKKIEELIYKWKRALADYQNLERRIEQEKKEFVKFSNAGLIDKLLSVLDDLERAELHLRSKGLTLAVDQLRSILKTEGVVEIKALVAKFEPMLMDCVEVIKGEKDVVIEVIQKGYLLNDKVLRPAKVKVGQGKIKGGK